jgi:hypothetical protein
MQEAATTSQGHQGSEADARQAAQASTSGQTLKQEAQRDRAAVADKLIAVFLDKAPAEWRKLIAFSKQWPSLADRYSAIPCLRVHAAVQTVHAWQPG